MILNSWILLIGLIILGLGVFLEVVATIFFGYDAKKEMWQRSTSPQTLIITIGIVLIFIAATGWLT